jgi:hypothetical protein
LTVRILGVSLIVGGGALLAWFMASQRPVQAVRRGRRRVRFDHSLDLTAPVAAVAESEPFVLAPDDRPISRRVLGLFWLLLLIAVVAVGIAGGLWSLGRLIFRAITNGLGGG